MRDKAYRYAIFAVPPRDSALWHFGCAWLGRDPEGGPTPPLPAGLTIPEKPVIEAPMRYGFHGTLKPPFKMHEETAPSALFDAVERLAEDLPTIRFERMIVRMIGRFLAIVPDPTPPALKDLAARLVIELDHFRMPPTQTELSRRRAAGLSERQETLLSKWGYPYVLDEFKFHMTLTGRMAEERLAELQSTLTEKALAAGALSPITFREVAIYAEAAPDSTFRLIRRVPLGRNI